MCWRSLQKWSEIELRSPYGFIKKFWQIHLRDSHKKFPEKNKVDNYDMSKITRLDWSKTSKQFLVNSLRKFLYHCQYQANRRGRTSTQIFLFRILDTFQPFRLLFQWSILYFSFWEMYIVFLTSTFDFCWSLVLQFSYRV